jgi:hypothetical protein
MYHKSPDIDDKTVASLDEQQALLDLLSTGTSAALEAFNTNPLYHDPNKIKEAALRALERLGEVQSEHWREMVPAYEITYDHETDEMLCSFYMDVPYVEARVILLRPEDQTKEEFELFVDEIIADLEVDFAEL